MTVAGLAWHYKKSGKEQSEKDRALYADEKREARLRRRGLWRDADTVPPGEWRKGR